MNNGTKQMKSSTKAQFPGAKPEYSEIQTSLFIKKKNTLETGDGKHF